MYYTTNGIEIKPLDTHRRKKQMTIGCVKFASPRDNSFRQGLSINKKYYKINY